MSKERNGLVSSFWGFQCRLEEETESVFLGDCKCLCSCHEANARTGATLPLVYQVRVVRTSAEQVFEVFLVEMLLLESQRLCRVSSPCGAHIAVLSSMYWAALAYGTNTRTKIGWWMEVGVVWGIYTPHISK
jgi:hypothetical protein